MAQKPFLRAAFMALCLCMGFAAQAQVQSSGFIDPCKGKMVNGVCSLGSDKVSYDAGSEADLAKMRAPCAGLKLNSVCMLDGAAGMCVIKKLMGTAPVCMTFRQDYSEE